MRRQSFRRRNALFSSSTALAGAAVLGVALLLLVLRLLFPATTLTLAAPLWNLGNALSGRTGALLDGFGNASALAAQNRSLTEQNVALANENAALAAKNADLIKLVGTETPKRQGVVAGVVVRPPESPYGTLVVAAGAETGVAAGDVVLAQGGVPVGTVTSVSAHMARVTLYVAAGEKRDAWVGTARTPIIINGEGSSFVASVPRADTIAVGDAVYLAGPGAVPAGTVMHISGDGSAPTEELAISSAVNPQSLTWVEIVGSEAP